METVPYLFIRRECIVMFYVDGLFLFARDEEIIKEIKASLRKRFAFKGLRKTRLILCWKLKWNCKGSLFLSQAVLVTRLLNDKGMQNAELVGSPIDPRTMENSERVPALDTHLHNEYSTRKGSLTFLVTRTRQVSVVSESILSSHLENSTTANMARKKTTLSSLKITSCHAMKIKPSRERELTA